MSAGEFGEPWRDAYGANENVLMDKDKAQRAAECVDALDGCPDPKDMREALTVLNHLLKTQSAKAAINCFIHDPAFAWIREGE